MIMMTLKYYCDNCKKEISLLQHQKGKGLCQDCIKAIN